MPPAKRSAIARPDNQDQTASANGSAKSQKSTALAAPLPSLARRTTRSSTAPPDSPSSSRSLTSANRSDKPDQATRLKKDAGTQVDDGDSPMFHSASAERTGLRERNVEDIAELEEKGLLQRVEESDEEDTVGRANKDKGKHRETRIEKVVDDSVESPEGLNNPRDRNAFALLILLYLLQGIPLGLTFGTLPFILKSHLSYSQLAVFALATWPYSLKLLWSPIVDAWFVPKWGRRKSWIVPVQSIVGLGLWIIGGRIGGWLEADEINVNLITAVFGSLILAAATQDIAVDGWALTLLSTPNLSYASTAQTIGLGIGNALSFTVFLAFDSAEFSNKYFRTVPQEYGLVSLGGYMRFWAVVFLLVTVGIALYKTEDPVAEDDPDMDVKKVYKVMWSIVQLKNIQSFLLVLLVCKIGFLVNDSVTGLKLLEKGLSKEDLAVAVLLDFPAQMIAGWVVAQWCRPSPGRHPLSGTGDVLRPWIVAFWARLGMAIVSTLVVWSFPNGKISNTYFGIVVASTLLSSLTSTVQFISICAFHTQIADPLIGGTYMTLLNTISNLGGTMPKPLILRGVDLLTRGQCSLSKVSGNCAVDPVKAQCEGRGGKCVIEQDGYFIMSAFCVSLGAIVLVVYILPTVKRLQSLPMSAWRVKLGRL